MKPPVRIESGEAVLARRPGPVRHFVIYAAIVTLTCVSGCGQKPTAYGIAESNSSWTTNITDPNRTLGIDAASVSFITLQAGPSEGVPFVVWSDLPNGNSGSGGGKIGGASYEGQHRATDGRGVQFHGETTDGKTGTVTIADVPYDLANGSLFLVSTQRDPPTVAQIAYDTSKFPKGKDQPIRLAKSIPDIRAFWEKHKKTNEGGENE